MYNIMGFGFGVQSLGFLLRLGVQGFGFRVWVSKIEQVLV